MDYQWLSGEDIWIEPPLTLAMGNTVSIGDGTYINSNLTLVDDYKITIGKKVLIAPNVTISGTNHPMHYKARPRGEMYCKEVIIETNLNRFRRSVKGVWQHDKSRRNHEFR